MSVQAPKYTLGEVVDDYLIRKFNQRRKYFANYFRIAQDIHKDIYRTIMPTIISKYVQVIDDEPYPYINVPEHCVKFFSVSVTNKNNELLQVFYNEKLNVFSKPPVVRKCGCTSTDLCDCIDNLQVIITPKEIDGVTYYQKDWVVCCDNGDVKQYSEVPVKKFGGQGGSYGNDFNNDYQIIQEGDNVVVLQFTKNLGRLETKDCGCPLDTANNKEIIYNKCGQHLGLKPSCCKVWYVKTQIHCTGEMKFSECGTRIYLKDVKADNGWVVASYQTDPVRCGEEILVDDYAREAIWYGIEEQSIIFYPRSTEADKHGARQRRMTAYGKLWEFLNPINSDRFFNIPTAELKL